MILPLARARRSSIPWHHRRLIVELARAPDGHLEYASIERAATFPSLLSDNPKAAEHAVERIARDIFPLVSAVPAVPFPHHVELTLQHPDEFDKLLAVADHHDFASDLLKTLRSWGLFDESRVMGSAMSVHTLRDVSAGTLMATAARRLDHSRFEADNLHEPLNRVDAARHCQVFGLPSGALADELRAGREFGQRVVADALVVHDNGGFRRLLIHVDEGPTARL